MLANLKTELNSGLPWRQKEGISTAAGSHTFSHTCALKHIAIYIHLCVSHNHDISTKDFQMIQPSYLKFHYLYFIPAHGQQ